MKNILLTLLCVLALVAAPVAVFAHGEGEASLSVMTLSVKQAKSASKAEVLKNHLMTVKGVKSVDINQDVVVVKYSKAEMGCCSAVYNALEAGKVKYTLVSNEERPACSGTAPAPACTKKKES